MSSWRKKDSDLGECALCPAPATTEDHMPPKGIFAKGMPNKSWVPVCRSCNGGASLDDEYMQRLSMLWGADACKDAIEVGEKFLRSLERAEARGLQAEVRPAFRGIAEPWDRICPTRQYTAGLYTGGLARGGRRESAGLMNRSVRGVLGTFWSLATLSQNERNSGMP